VRHAAEDRVAVGTGGELGQVLGDLDARDVGGDRVELAAELGRGVGLEVGPPPRLTKIAALAGAPVADSARAQPK
jgi:hypothetical protein